MTGTEDFLLQRTMPAISSLFREIQGRMGKLFEDILRKDVCYFAKSWKELHSLSESI